MNHSYLTLQTRLDDTVKRDHKFSIQSLTGEEGICEEFSYKINVCSPERLTASDSEKLIGNKVTLNIAWSDSSSKRKTRYINGLVYGLTELGMSRAPHLPDIWQYEIDLSSWLKKLDFISDCRIFQKPNNNSIRIVSDILREYGFHDFRSEVSRKLVPRKYSVLYNESILNYIKRLLLEDGILWHYEHHENKHVLVLTANALDLPEIPLENMPRTDMVQSFRKKKSHLPVGSYSRASYRWENQQVKTIKKPVNYDTGKLHHFEYIPNFNGNEEGEEIVARYCTNLVGESGIYEGESTIRAFASGHRFTLTAPVLSDLNGKSFLLRKLKIEATQSKYRNCFTALPGTEGFFENELKGVKTPKVLGPQTAVVVGEGGNGHVRTQAEGCVKVRFHWDHYSPKDASHTSAYLRLTMPGAGERRGMLFVPKIGEEVVVDFENGNPDKPLIIGSVYSRHNPPPFKPNTQPFKSIIKNASAADSNQVVFNDNPGQENLEIIAKKDMTMAVSRDFNIDAVNNINIKAKSIVIVSKDSINVAAGKNIENTSLATIINLGLAAIMNTACVNILDLALGIVYNKSGGLVSQLAGGILANTSALGIKQASDNLIKNTSAALLLNTSPAVINSGDKSINTKAGLAILNSASEAISNESDKKTGDALVSMTEAKNAAVKGNTTMGS